MGPPQHQQPEATRQQLRAEAAPPTIASGVVCRWLSFASHHQAPAPRSSCAPQGAEYSDYCSEDGGNTPLGAVAAFLPARLSSQAQFAVAMLAGGSSGGESGGADDSSGSGGGGGGCRPIYGDDLLNAFSLGQRSRWGGVAYAACTFPVLALAFYAGVRLVRHEHR